MASGDIRDGSLTHAERLGYDFLRSEVFSAHLPDCLYLLPGEFVVAVPFAEHFGVPPFADGILRVVFRRTLT